MRSGSCRRGVEMGFVKTKFEIEATERNLAGRALEGTDVALAIELLSRPEMSMTTGERIRVDGGVNL